MKLLETYIKRCIITEQQQQDNNIIKAIAKKFPADYAIGFAGAGAEHTLANNKQDVFWNRYDTNEAFRKQMNSSYIYNGDEWFDFWLLQDEFRKYLKPELQSAELLLTEAGRVSALKISDVSSALEIAENVEEFEEMVKTLR